MEQHLVEVDRFYSALANIGQQGKKKKLTALAAVIAANKAPKAL